jgi:ubiquinone/menaquinone biosynthesis C-methylase UbiE
MTSPRAFSGHSASAARWFALQESWWPEHYTGIPAQISEFLRGDGISLEGRDVLDLGCGDGIGTLGMASVGVGSVLGVDLEEVDVAFLGERAAGMGIGFPHPKLSFVTCEPNLLPVEDASMDLVTAWSVFEHVDDPTALMREVHRVLRPDGLFFLQIWPMWSSEHGSHLWPWFPSGHDHLVLSDAEIAATLETQIPSRPLRESFVGLKESCNHATIDELQVSLVEAGFYIAKVALQGDTFHVRPELQSVPLSRQGISGIKLLAVRH